MNKILVVDDKQMMRDSVSATLVRAGYAAVTAENGEAALKAIARHRPGVMLTDLRMPGMDGLELLQAVKKLDPDLPVVLMTAFATVETAVSALKSGAFDYIQKPFEGEQLVATVRRAVEHYGLRHENAVLKQAGNAPREGRSLIGRSAAMLRLREQIEQVARSNGTVLIRGESGTGKEVVAQMIHSRSDRGESPMLCLNCAALSSALLESELFGHEKGAFTGAEQMRKGRFELAEGGTLLLDEISEVGLPTQAKLLRVLQERQFERVGSSLTLSVDVRIVATSNRSLEESVRKNEFRQDLFYRLNVLPIVLPPLRDRSQDIPLLAEHFLAQQARREGREAPAFDREAMTLLMSYRWPGNVRELENICERAMVLCDRSGIPAKVIEPWLTGALAEPESVIRGVEGRTLEEMEREVIVRTLGHYGGHRERTARALGIGVRTLGLKLKKWKENSLVSASL